MSERNEKGGWGRFLVIISIGIFSLVVVVYDLIAYMIWGRPETISPPIQMWGWTAHPLVMICLGMVIGGLLVHFFRWKP